MVTCIYDIYLQKSAAFDWTFAALQDVRYFWGTSVQKYRTNNTDRNSPQHRPLHQRIIVDFDRTGQASLVGRWWVYKLPVSESVPGHHHGLCCRDGSAVPLPSEETQAAVLQSRAPCCQCFTAFSLTSRAEYYVLDVNTEPKPPKERADSLKSFFHSLVTGSRT